MKRNILIVEDNEKHMEVIEKLLSDIDNIQIFKAYNMPDACYMLSLNEYSIFIVDIILNNDVSGDVSGIDFINHIRGMKKYQFTPVIFVTSLEDPKLCAYSDLHCYQYIEKPFDKEHVLKIVRKALEFSGQREDREYAYFRKDGILYSIKVADVMYAVISRTWVEIFTEDDCLRLPYYTMADIMSKLGENKFVKCSRNTIVNKNHIEYVDLRNGYIKLKGVKKQIEIGAIIKKLLGEKLNKDV